MTLPPRRLHHLSRLLLACGLAAGVLATTPRLQIAGPQTASGPAGAPHARRIVLLDEQLFPQRRALLEQLRAAALRRAAPGETAPVLAALAAGATRSQSDLRRWARAHGGEVERHYWVIAGAAIRLPSAAIDALAAVDGVRSVHRDAHRGAQLKVCTNSANHNADLVHALGGDGGGANLALLDSGIDTDVAGTGVPHPAFDRKSAGGSRIVQATGIAMSGDLEDLTGHGTAVAAIAAGADWGNPFGFSDDGFAPGAGVVSYKVTAGSSMSLSTCDVISAWQQVLADAASLEIRVANLSFSGDPDPTAPGQQALDQAAYSGDILVVTSAGNGGQDPIPAGQSQANASGLVVGAVEPDGGQPAPHAVLPSSTRGPLPGDGSRYFPDLVACGKDVRSALIDSSVGVSTNTGTSFAAPQVAGTALLLRAAHPGLSALDTKALILNNVADIAASNPGATRFDHGLGLLRTDLAYTAAGTALPQSGQLDAGQAITTASFVHAVVAGKSYAATLTWPRTDVASSAWDNLDLLVLDPAGEVIAMANTPRNLYERALFTPATTGNYTLLITGTELTTSGALPFSLALGENLGGGKQAGSYVLFGQPCVPAGPECLGSAADPDQGTVVPAPATGAFVGSRTRVPFSHYSTRLMQAYPGTALPASLTVDRIALRRDEQQWHTETHDVTLEILLGYTRKPPGQLESTFQNNVDGLMTQVVSPRSVRFLGTQGLPRDAGQFDYIIPLDAPFTINATPTRHLLLEVRVFSHSMGSVPFNLFFDALEDPSVSRVYSDGDPQAQTGIVDSVALVASLMSPGSGSTQPELQAVGRPQLGETFALTLRHAPPQATAVLFNGNSQTAWAGVPLPFSLGPFGALGCCLLVDSVIDLPVLVGADGTAEVPYPIPVLSALTGGVFYNQFLILDAAANPVGLTTTNAGRALIGG